ncbi:MAG: crossover junction endodeoxyribonuclease RuvC [Clostridia bacterium]|nr:crossover junction endodeoxyribonuclease RuvC [Clostridia bacterium]
MIILGIDPGIATLGYGVVEKDERGAVRAVDYGVVTTPKEQPLPARLILLEEGVARLLEKYRPDEIALEELFFTKNITNGIAVAHARGVTMLACAKACPRLFEYTPMQIKQALTGYGRADKQQMQKVVTSVLHLKEIPRPDDAADALAVAVCHASVSRFGGLFAVSNTTRTKGNNAVSPSAFERLMKTGVFPGEEKEKPKRPRAKKPAASTVKTVKKPSVAGSASKELAAAIAAKMREAEEKGEKE